jgi:hypothetical protein
MTGTGEMVSWLRKTIEGDKLLGCVRSSRFIASGNL